LLRERRLPIETLAVVAAPLIIVAIFPHRWIALTFVGALIALVIFANRFAFASMRNLDAWAAFALFAIVLPLVYGALLFGVIALRRWARRRKTP